MKRILALAFILAISAGVADAKSCKDATGKFIKCPPAAAAMATPATPTATTAVRCKDAKGKFMKCPPADVKSDMAAAKTSAATDTKADGMPSVAHAPVCKVGKPCGRSCIAKDKVCHKPA